MLIVVIVCCFFLKDIQGNAEVFTTRNGPALSMFEKMQLYYTRKLKTQLTNPRLPQTGAGS